MQLIATLQCQDQPGIVNAMTSAILECSGNIIENQQFTDPITKLFVMRTKFDTDKTEKMSGQIINIHHSFLPGFKGAKPYHQAYEKGVKIIGATAHFVTKDLDEGPIIEQDITGVNHATTPDELISIGRDIERRVLSKAVKLFAEDRIFQAKNRTIIFN